MLPQHLLGLAGLVYYLTNPPGWEWWAAAYVSWVVLGVFGVSTVYHKIYAHRAFRMKPGFEWLRYALTFAGMLTGQGSPISYAVIHRNYHHPNADRNANDPHSPHTGSLWNAYYGWHFKMFYFSLRDARDLTSQKFLVWCHKNYYRVFLIAYFAVGLISFKVLFFCIVLPGLFHVHQMNILNSFSHLRWFGYRNFEIADHSVNNLVFGWLTWGTGFHNNHHAVPEAWHNQVQWYEFDPFRWIVPVIGEVENPAPLGIEESWTYSRPS